VKRILFLGLLGALMTASTGCGLFQAIFCYDSCGPRNCGSSMCGEPCDEGCGAGCGVVHRPVRTAGCCSARKAVVAECDDECGGECGRPCRNAYRGGCDTCDPCADPCTGRVWHRGPLSCVFALFTPNTWCGPSCGQRYWGDFYSDPPACHDPCDCYGNYADGGVSTGGVSTGGGCRSCGGGVSHARRGYVADEVDDGMTVSEGEELAPQAERVATPAPRAASGTPHKALKKPTQ
jgi:hypothetical protein